MNLDKSDLQKFFKRLRNAGHKPKYYACGEYGGKSNRPHYHVILFDVDPVAVELAWTYKNNPKDKTEDPKSLGYCHFGQVSEASIGYTLKYMQKASKVPIHRNDDRLKEFSLMSKGLGLNYITERVKKWHNDNPEQRVFCPLHEKKLSMPRYFRDKIFDESTRKKIADYWAAVETEKPELNDLDKQNQIQSHMAAFTRMQKLAEKGRDKI